jgi:hypothetical protein
LRGEVDVKCKCGSISDEGFWESVWHDKKLREYER